MVKSEIQLYKFGEFQIDTIKRVLLHDNSPVQLPSRAFDVLLALVEHNQCVIDKDELMRLVWGDRVVEENNLTRHISTLRKALDESPNDHRYIVTLPGRGYSFVATVQRVQSKIEQAVSIEQKSVLSSLEAESVDPARSYRPDHLTEVESSSELNLSKSASRRKLWVWSIVLLVILISGTLFIWKVAKTRTGTEAVSSYRDWDLVRLTRNGGSYRPDISRDGKYVAYVSSDAGKESVWILQLATSASRQIVPPERFIYFELLFNQDGSELYFARREALAPQRALYRISVLGGVARKLREDIDSPIAISPDGTKLAFARRSVGGKSEFIIATSDGLEERVLVGHTLQTPTWSPDGKASAYAVGNAASGADAMSVHEIRLEDGSERELSTRKWTWVGPKRWLPDGRGLIIIAREQRLNVNRLWLLPYPTGEPRPLSNELESFNDMSLTAAGNTLVAEQIVPVCDIWRRSLAEGASATKIGVWGMSGLCFAVDGRIIYSAKVSAESNEIWIMSGDGTERKQLTFDEGNDTSPLASPDGRYIVFVSNRSGNFEIWRMNLDGSNLVQLTNSKGATMPGISPDSKWITYLSTADTKLYKVALEGGQPIGLEARAVGASAVSPDGKHIGYFFPGKNGWGIAVDSFENGLVTNRFDYNAVPLNNRVLKWTPDGKALLYACSSDGVGDIWMQPLDGSTPRAITDFKTDGIFHFDVSSDGKDLICARGSWKHDIVLIKNLH